MAKKNFLDEKYAKVAVILAVALVGYMLYNGGFGEGKTITSDGTVTQSAMADQVEIHIGYSVTKETADAAQQESTAVVNAMMDALKAEGLTTADIQTSYYYVNPVYNYTDYYSGTQEITGYEARHILLIKTGKIESAGAYIDAAVGAGANQVEGVYFSLKSATENMLRTQLLGEAAQNARAKADAIATGLGLRVTGVKSIFESNFGYPPMYRDIAYGAVSESSGGSKNVASQLIPGSVEITATVSAEFSVV